MIREVKSMGYAHHIAHRALHVPRSKRTLGTQLANVRRMRRFTQRVTRCIGTCLIQTRIPTLLCPNIRRLRLREPEQKACGSFAFSFSAVDLDFCSFVT